VAIEIFAEEDGTVTRIIENGMEQPVVAGHRVESLSQAWAAIESGGGGSLTRADGGGSTRRTFLQRTVLAIGGVGLYMGLRNLSPTMKDKLPPVLEVQGADASHICSQCTYTYNCGSCKNLQNGCPGKWRRTFASYTRDYTGRVVCVKECTGYCFNSLECACGGNLG